MEGREGGKVERDGWREGERKQGGREWSKDMHRDKETAVGRG